VHTTEARLQQGLVDEVTSWAHYGVGQTTVGFWLIFWNLNDAESVNFHFVPNPVQRLVELPHFWRFQAACFVSSTAQLETMLNRGERKYIDS
jgi:hypothetical protein